LNDQLNDHGGLVMLEHLSDPGDDVRECLQHVEDCKSQAKEQSDPALRQDFLDAARRWLFLAHSYERALAPSRPQPPMTLN
jgi:hypothetical protein